MTSNYSFNYEGLEKLVTDLQYLIMKGGASKKFLSEKNINIINKSWKYIFLFFKLVALIIIGYLLYIILFRGYPRFFYNLLTLSFSHKEDLDKFLKEGSSKESSLFQDNLLYILNNSNGLIIIGKIINKTNDIDNLKNSIDKYVNLITNIYTNDKFFRSLKEYFIFDNVMNDNKIKSIVTNYNSKDGNSTYTLNINNYAFYNKLGEYLINIGEYETIKTNGIKKDDNYIDAEIFDTKKQYFANIKNINEIIKNITNNITAIINDNINNNYLSYILLPIYKNDLNTFCIEISGISKIDFDSIISYDIFNKNFNLSSSHYIMGEIYLSLNKGYTYNKLSNLINQIKITNNDKKYIVAYLNATENNKKELVNKLEWKNYELFIFLTLFPIFSNIYFTNNTNIKNKEQTYKGVMNTYNILGNNETDLNKFIQNLEINIPTIKQLYLSFGYLHLLLNTYKTDFTNLYNKQILGPKNFFIELIEPINNDLIVNKIGNNAKQVFSKISWDGGFKDFEIKFNTFGKQLEKVVKDTYKAFFTSQKIENPKETKTSM